MKKTRIAPALLMLSFAIACLLAVSLPDNARADTFTSTMHIIPTQVSIGTKKWQAVSSSADGTRLVAAAMDDYIYASTDSGQTWMPMVSSGSRKWQAVSSSADGTHIVAAVLNDLIYTSSDSGATWTARASSSPRKWQSLSSSADGSRIAAVVSGGDIYISSDSGATWTDVSAGKNTAGLKWVSVASSADGTRLVAAVNNGGIYTSSDSGNSWTLNSSAGSRAWVAVTSSADGTRLAAIPAKGYVFTSANGGVTWAARATSGSRAWQTVTTSADGMHIEATIAGGILTSADAGTTWKSLAYYVSGNSQAIASSADGSHVLIAVNGGDLYVSLYYGAASSDVTTPKSIVNYGQIASSADGMHLAVIPKYLNDPGYNNGFIWLSSDGGSTWKPVLSTGSRRWISITSSADGTHLAATDASEPGVFHENNVSGDDSGNYNGYVWTSSDSGATWTPRLTPRHWSNVVSSADGMHLAAASLIYAYTSSDGGATWKQNNLPVPDGLPSPGIDYDSSNGPFYSFDGIDYLWYDNDPYLHNLVSSADGMHLSAVQTDNIILTSSNGGASWTPRNPGNLGFFDEFARTWAGISLSSDGTKIVAAELFGHVYVSSDGGASWKARSLPVPGGRIILYSAAFSPDGTRVFVTDVYGNLYSSSDLGVTWTTSPLNLSIDIYTKITPAAADGSKLIIRTASGINIATGVLSAISTLPASSATSTATSTAARVVTVATSTLAAPTATFTANGLVSTTVKVGDTVKYAWRSTGADSFSSDYTTSNCKGQGGASWVITTAGGTNTASAVQPSQAGCTYILNFRAKQKSTGSIAVATVTVSVAAKAMAATVTGTASSVPSSVATSTAMSNQPAAPTAVLTANGASDTTVKVGDKVSYAWNSANADVFGSTYTSTCGVVAPLPWVARNASGTFVSDPVASVDAGCVYTAHFNARQSSTGRTATAILTMRIVKK